MDLESTENPGRFFTALSRDLKSIALSNIQYFQNGKQSHHAKFHLTFSLLHEYLDIGIEPSYEELSKCVSLYDFSPEIKGNGYRSLLRVVQKCCLHLLQLCRYISSVRDSILFRRGFYAKELESYVSALGQLRAVLYYALKLVHYCQDGELFVDESKLNSEVAEELVVDVENLSQESFYGRCLGFQFCQSMQRPLQVLAIAMASYSEGYLESSQVMQVATSVFNSGKYILDPELRAQQVVKVTRTADIKFCKAFWGFSESTLMHQLPSFVCPSVEVNEVITLGPDAFELSLMDGSDTVVITPPCAHTGPGHVYTRLICAHLRDGQQALRKASKLKSPVSSKPKTAGLIVHIHGGGFVAQSSKSHEVYLREWALTVAVPILSVDYSLAPELPFPRALEECFYAYAWTVQNCGLLGSTGEKIVLVGDSAGANLAIATAMRAASFGIRRPDGILAVYPCTVVRYTPSPARLLSLLDPVLPFGLITRCLAAYAGINEQEPMASPQVDDVHSRNSLTSIQIKSEETMDDEWIIISQDDKQGRNKTKTSSTGQKSSPDVTSVANALQPMLSPNTNIEMSSADQFNMVLNLENDIFSQLEHDGSVAFPSDTQNANLAGNNQQTNMSKNDQLVLVRHDENANVNRNEVQARSRSKPSLSHLGMFQKRARMVVEGAQNMLSKVSSYMPATKDVSTKHAMSCLSSMLPVSTAAQEPESGFGDSELFSNIETCSDVVDDISAHKKQHFLGVSEVGSGLSDLQTDMTVVSSTQDKSSFPVVVTNDCDSIRSHSPTETPTLMSFSSSLPKYHSTSGNGSQHGMSALCSDTCSLVPDSCHRQQASNISVDDHKVISPLDDISVHSDSVMVTPSSFATISTSSSQAFDTAHSSPGEHAMPGSSSLDNCESISVSSDSCTHAYSLNLVDAPCITSLVGVHDESQRSQPASTAHDAENLVDAPCISSLVGVHDESQRSQPASTAHDAENLVDAPCISSLVGIHDESQRSQPASTAHDAENLVDAPCISSLVGVHDESRRSQPASTAHDAENRIQSAASLVSVSDTQSQSDKLCSSDRLHDTISNTSLGTVDDIHRDTVDDIHQDIVDDIHGDSVDHIHQDTVDGIHRNTVDDIHRDTVNDIHRDTVNDIHRDTVYDIHRDTIDDIHGDTVDDIHGDTVDNIHGDTMRREKSSFSAHKNVLPVYSEMLFESPAMSSGTDNQQQLLSPASSVTSFVIDDHFMSSPVSPSLLPNLPEENMHLLEDALQTDDHSFVSLPVPEFLNHQFTGRYNQHDVQETCHSLNKQEDDTWYTQKHTGHLVADGELSCGKMTDGDHNSHNIVDEDQSSYKVDKGIHNTINYEERSSSSHRVDNEEQSSHRVDNEEQSSHRVDNEEQSSHRVDNEEQSSHRVDNEEQSSHRVDNEEQSSHRVDNEEQSSHRVDSEDIFSHKINSEQNRVTKRQNEVDGMKNSEIEHRKPMKPTSLNLDMTTNPSTLSKNVVSSTSSENVDDQKKQCPVIHPNISSEGLIVKRQLPTISSGHLLCQSSLPSSPTVSKSDGFLRHGSLPLLAPHFSPSIEISHHRTVSPSQVTLHQTTLHDGQKIGMIPSDFEKQNFIASSPLHTLRKAPVVNNPYMSPLLASDDLLRGLPMVSIVACHLDPLLDDSVMFARRLTQSPGSSQHSHS